MVLNNSTFARALIAIVLALLLVGSALALRVKMTLPYLDYARIQRRLSQKEWTALAEPVIDSRLPLG